MDRNAQSLARRALPGVMVPEIPWDKPWIVFAKPVAQSAEQVLAYLGRYVHRTALSDKAMIAADADLGTVTFGYRDSREQRRRSMTLPGHEFLRRFLQHVPAKGFHRVRSFGCVPIAASRRFAWCGASRLPSAWRAKPLPPPRSRRWLAPRRHRAGPPQKRCGRERARTTSFNRGLRAQRERVFSAARRGQMALP